MEMTITEALGIPGKKQHLMKVVHIISSGEEPLIAYTFRAGKL